MRFEVGGSVCDLGKVKFHWIVIHFTGGGRAAALADSSLTHGLATSAHQLPDKPLLEKNCNLNDSLIKWYSRPRHPGVPRKYTLSECHTSFWTEATTQVRET